jgi:hypothetical protein
MAGVVLSEAEGVMPDRTLSLNEAQVANDDAAVVVMSAEEYERLPEAPDGAERSSIWLDPRFRILTDEEHDRIFARDRDVGRPPIEF